MLEVNMRKSIDRNTLNTLRSLIHHMVSRLALRVRQGMLLQLPIRIVALHINKVALCQSRVIPKVVSIALVMSIRSQISLHVSNRVITRHPSLITCQRILL